MSKELTAELKLLGAGEELVIKNTGKHIVITRNRKVGGLTKSYQRGISFREMETARIDHVAYAIGRLRELISNDILEQLSNATGWGESL